MEVQPFFVSSPLSSLLSSLTACGSPRPREINETPPLA